MRRIINSTSVSIFAQFALGTVCLSAASESANGNEPTSGLVSAIIGVVVPALLVIGIGGGLCAWLRRNKTSFARFFSRRKMPTSWDVSQSTSMPSSPSPVAPRRTAQPESTPRTTERNNASLEPKPYTLEFISLTDLKQVLPLREAGRAQEYYESIAMVIKHYVEKKYQIKTLDATTGQILSALPDDLTDSVADHVGEILRTCDMIHFSHHRPSRPELKRIYQTAKEFIESQIVVGVGETSNLEEDVDENNETDKPYGWMMS